MIDTANFMVLPLCMNIIHCLDAFPCTNDRVPGGVIAILDMIDVLETTRKLLCR